MSRIEVTRQVHLQRKPTATIVERHIDTELSTCVEQVFLFWIFTHRYDERRVDKSGCNWLPSLAIISGFEEVGGAVVDAVAVDRGVGDGRVEVRWLD